MSSARISEVEKQRRRQAINFLLQKDKLLEIAQVGNTKIVQDNERVARAIQHQRDAYHQALEIGEQLKKKKLRLDGILSKLETQIRTKEGETREAQARYDEVEESLVSIQRTALASKARIGELTCEVSRLEQKELALHKERADFEGRISELQRGLEESQRREQAAKAESAEMHQRMEHLVRQMEEKQKQIDEVNSIVERQNNTFGGQDDFFTIHADAIIADIPEPSAFQGDSSFVNPAGLDCADLGSPQPIEDFFAGMGQDGSFGQQVADHELSFAGQNGRFEPAPLMSSMGYADDSESDCGVLPDLTGAPRESVDSWPETSVIPDSELQKAKQPRRKPKRKRSVDEDGSRKRHRGERKVPVSDNSDWPWQTSSVTWEQVLQKVNAMKRRAEYEVVDLSKL